MSDTLFDLPAPIVDTHDGEAPLSYGRRLTLRNQTALASGRHPATRLPLDPDPEHKCGTCGHHQAVGYHNRVWHKCELHPLGLSHSEASDIRLSWPACVRWEATP